MSHYVSFPFKDFTSDHLILRISYGFCSDTEALILIEGDERSKIRVKKMLLWEQTYICTEVFGQ